jgi:hypothetical protein
MYTEFSKRLTAATFALLLAGCSERYIVAANDQVMVVVDDLKPGDDASSAKVHYVMAAPQPLSDLDRARATAMTYDASFRCADRSWGHTAQRLTMESGETITREEVEPAMEKPTTGSLAEDIVTVVCDPAARSEAATRRTVTSLRKDYLERMGQSG